MGLYQAHFAEMIGVDECTVTNWEKNRTNPALWTIPKVIEFLGHDPTLGDPNTFGGRLFRCRKTRGMTQKVLARQIGIDPTTLSRLVRNNIGYSSSIKKVTTFLDANASNEKPLAVRPEAAK